MTHDIPLPKQPDTTVSDELDEPLDPIRVFSIKLTTAMAFSPMVPEKLYEWESELEQAYKTIIAQEVTKALDRITEYTDGELSGHDFQVVKTALQAERERLIGKAGK